MEYSFTLTKKDIFNSLLITQLRKPPFYIVISGLVSAILSIDFFTPFLIILGSLILFTYISTTKSVDLLGSCTISLSDDQITFACPVYRNQTNANVYQQIIKSKHYLILILKKQNGIVPIPTRAFSTEEQRDQFVQALEDIITR